METFRAIAPSAGRSVGKSKMKHIVKILSENFVLVDVSISSWSGRKKDNATSWAVHELKNAKSTSGSFWKKLINSEELKQIETIKSRIYQAHYNLTNVGLGSHRLVSTTYYVNKYEPTMRKLTDEFNENVEKFLDSYPEQMCAQAERLGDMFDITDYPSVFELRSKFKVNISVMPIPDTKYVGAPIAAGMGENAFAFFDEKFHEQMSETFENLVNDSFGRVIENARSFYDKLKHPDKRDNLRYSTVEGLLSQCVDCQNITTTITNSTAYTDQNTSWNDTSQYKEIASRVTHLKDLYQFFFYVKKHDLRNSTELLRMEDALFNFLTVMGEGPEEDEVSFAEAAVSANGEEYESIVTKMNWMGR